MSRFSGKKSSKSAGKTIHSGGSEAKTSHHRPRHTKYLVSIECQTDSNPYLNTVLYVREGGAGFCRAEQTFSSRFSLGATLVIDGNEVRHWNDKNAYELR